MAIAIKPGMQFDRLTAMRKVSTKVHNRGQVEIWELRCECGTVIQRRADSLHKKGRGRSCGCHMRAALEVVEVEARPGARLVRERHVEGKSFGYAPSSGRCSLEYV
jgi:hypothetical protein